MRLATLLAAGCMATGALSLPAMAATTQYYATTFSDINSFGASGTASAAYDPTANTLAVHILAYGLAPDQLHVAHIHGTFDSSGNPTDATMPTLASDTDGDGIIELAEAVPNYGPILLSLNNDTMPGTSGFSTAPGGVLSFDYTYNLATTSSFGKGYSAGDLMPLDFREIVIHGAFLKDGQGSGPGEADGTAGYKTVLPVLVGELHRVPAPVPVPAAGAMLLTALGGFGAIRARRNKRAA